ncbi:MAG: RNA polymerase sigma factor [Phycisphaerales bacterium]|nr:RNA polymerase sigma factor [Phycisphaerales bacterium]
MKRPTKEPTAHEVFELLARDHADHLMVFLRAVVYDRSLVDDVFQETMMVAWRRLADFDKSRSFGAWLRGIGSRVAMDMAGRRRMAIVDPTILSEIEQHSARFDGDHALSFHNRMAAVDDCLAKLPDMYAEVIRMVYRTDVPIRAVAKTLENNEESIKKRLQRARTLLGECLQRKGVFA